MDRVLLDTNIFSYFYKRHHLALLYRPMIVGRPVVISFQTKAELNEVPWRAGWGLSRRTLLDDFLMQFAVIHSDDNVCDHWGRIRAFRRQQPISTNDAWIAATALSYDLDLVTHNPKDFRNIPGLKVLTVSK